MVMVVKTAEATVVPAAALVVAPAVALVVLVVALAALAVALVAPVVVPAVALVVQVAPAAATTKPRVVNPVKSLLRLFPKNKSRMKKFPSAQEAPRNWMIFPKQAIAALTNGCCGFCAALPLLDASHFADKTKQ